MPHRFHLLDAQSHGPKHPNEDAHGATGRTAWIIDGATGVGVGPELLPPSGAAWLARTLSDALSAHAPEAAGVDDLLARASEAITAAFASVAGAQALEAEDHPSACLGVAHLADGVLDLACIGDVSLLHGTEGGEVHLFTDDAVAAFGGKTLEALRAVRERFPGEDPWPHVRPQVRANRRMANQPGGYAVVHPTLPWTKLVKHLRRPVAAGDLILLSSDGFWRLVDHFDLHAPDTLVAAARERGLVALIEDLRAAEREDAEGRRAPRVKRHDDATALLLRVEDDGSR
ncbi:protein phosphatase 2C domain-containing protein [Alsobacter sp. SYSU M60028]|uniref:Protein phosphatase 2C domain-containing protein n=1 Tax=Alsobacter ponti TaxID=2962936 RepID=A0ABT1L9U3_9HYPH|nr:protein phosphatase 2C domain-containing protein [Alsobacter ponti]MCP8938267.1 protein phosphatase 2C domain-containing protein [Alsobacter ponti]